MTQRLPKGLPTRALLLCVFLFAIASPARALETEFQLWSATFLNVGTQRDSGVVGWLDLHARRFGAGGLMIVRPGLGYRFFPSLTIHLGYGWVGNFLDNVADRHEHHVWQQLLWSPRLTRSVAFSLRPRLEERFNQGSGELGLRFRLFMRLNWRLGGTPLVLGFWDEVFFELNETDWGQNGGFSENRIFAGVGILGPWKMRVDVGYLNIVLHPDPTRMNHNLLVSLNFNL